MAPRHNDAFQIKLQVDDRPQNTMPPCIAEGRGT